MSDPRVIEPATPADLMAVLDLLTRSALPTAGVAEHLSHAFVARDGHDVVGSAALEIYADGALLRSVAVDADHRGTGLGQRLTATALSDAERRHLPAVFLLTTTAERFFPRFGFAVITRGDVPASLLQSVEFRSACPDSAVVMRKPLQAPFGLHQADETERDETRLTPLARGTSGRIGAESGVDPPPSPCSIVLR